ncbi:MAG: hypothetical protein WC791_03245 [Candidatus Paceibacterota bacterium]|jgi:pantothenate kinase
MKPLDFSNIVFPKTINVTEQEIDISNFTEKQKQFYIDLFKELVERYQSKQKPRMIVGITGPAGSGKSAVVAIFQEIAKQVTLPFKFESIGIDAFHYTNEYLLAHDVNGDSLKSHKGRFDTYDIEKLTNVMKRFSVGGEVQLPVYSRATHNPVENAINIKRDEPALLVVEGLWVLYDQAGWNTVGELLNYSIFVEGDNEKLKQGVIDRHIRGGRTSDEAKEYYEANESQNFDLIMTTKNKADKIIPAYYEI